MSILRMISAASGVIEAPDLWEKRLPAKFADLCPRLVETGGGVAWTAAHKMTEVRRYEAAVGNPHVIQQRKLGRADVAWLSTAEGRRWIQDRDEAAGEVLYSVGGVWDLINASGNEDFITACYRAYNDWLSELVAADPNRFIGIAKIPTTGITHATAELKRAAEDLGLRGAVLDVWPAGADAPPSFKECDSFWEAAAALGMPISIYTALNGTKEEEEAIAAGNAPEYFQDLTTIIYANICDRFAGIRFVSVSPNVGWAPPVFESLNESYMRTAALRKVNLGNPDLYPSDYLRRFVWFVTQQDKTALLNRKYFGDAHLMWGSFAFMRDSAWPNTMQMFERLTAGMPDDVRRFLAADVTAKLYGIGNAGRFTPEEINTYDSYALL